MDPRPTPLEALNQLVEALGPEKRTTLSTSIEVLRILIEPRTSGPGSFWQDPERGARARAAMKASWAARPRSKMQLTWRSNGRTETHTDYDEVGKLVGRSTNTVRCVLAKGKGLAYFVHDDDIITVQRF